MLCLPRSISLFRPLSSSSLEQSLYRVEKIALFVQFAIIAAGNALSTLSCRVFAFEKQNIFAISFYQLEFLGDFLCLCFPFL